MHLFGDSGGPHLVHFHARREHDEVELTWQVRNTPPLSWRVLRSESDFAETADALVGSGQTVVMEGRETWVVDSVTEGTTYYYTVFAQDEHGVWHRQVKAKPHEGHLYWEHPSVPPTEATSTNDGKDRGTAYRRRGEVSAARDLLELGMAQEGRDPMPPIL